jgi:hypothetical protein
MLESGGPLLLVLDDLWSEFQVKELLGEGTRLPPNSQLLLTSRRSDVVASYNGMPMKLLPEASALALLAWHACGQNGLPASLAEVAIDALRGCGGLPLAVRVLGGALRGVPATREAWKVTHWPYFNSAPKEGCWRAEVEPAACCSQGQQLTECCLVAQAKAAAFSYSAANHVIVDDKSMTQWLATSFWGLPSTRHRHMFLDAATLLQEQPLQDLRCAWTAMVQFDDDCVNDPDAAACSVSACLAELVTSSLISIRDDRDRQNIPQYCELEFRRLNDAERCVYVVAHFAVYDVLTV